MTHGQHREDNKGDRPEDFAPSTAERAAFPMAEAAALLGVSRQHLYSLIERGELRRVKLGRRALIPASELRRLIDGDEESKAV